MFVISQLGLTLPDCAISSSLSFEAPSPVNSFIRIALAKIKNGMKDRTTKDNFQPLYKAYTVQATAVVKEFTTIERRAPVA